MAVAIPVVIHHLDHWQLRREAAQEQELTEVDQQLGAPADPGQHLCRAGGRVLTQAIAEELERETTQTRLAELVMPSSLVLEVVALEVST